MSSLEKLWTLMSNFEFEIDGVIPDSVMCLLCKKLMIKPYSATCGCNFCGHCIKKYILDGGRRVCPGHSSKCDGFVLELGVTVMENVRMQSTISKVRVKCQRSLCSVVLPLAEMEEHVRVCTMVCPYNTIGCDSSMTVHGTMAFHLNSEILQHSRVLMDAINNLRNDVDNITKISDRREIIMNEQQREIEHLKTEKDRMKQKLEELKEHCDVSKIEFQNSKLGIEELVHKEMMNNLDMTRQREKIMTLEEMMNKFIECEREKDAIIDEQRGLSYLEMENLKKEMETKFAKIEENRLKDLIDIQNLKRVDKDMQMEKDLIELKERLRKNEEDRLSETEDLIKFKNLMKNEMENLKLKTGEYQRKCETEFIELKKCDQTTSIRVNDLRSDHLKLEEKRKLDQEDRGKEVDALIKYKKDIRMELENHKSKVEDLQKHCKRNKMEIEKCKKLEAKTNNFETVSDHSTLVTIFKVEQDRQARELQELKQDVKQVKTTTEKQKAAIEEMKKKDENTKIILNNVIHKCESNNVLPHIMLNDMCGRLEAQKADFVELSVFRDLKKQVIGNIKGISDVKNTVKEFCEKLKTISEKRTDSDLSFDFVWTFSDFSQQKKESEFLSDAFYRGNYRLCILARLDGYNLSLSLCILNNQGSKGSEWSPDNEFVLGIINQYTLRPQIFERLSYNTSRSKSLNRRCDSSIRLCIGGPCIPLANVVTIPGLLCHDSVMFYFSLTCNPK